MKAFAEDDPNRRSKTCCVVADAEAQASVETERILELMVEASKYISPGRRVGLRRVLSKDFKVETCRLLQVITEGYRLLTAVTTALGHLTVGLHQRAVHNDVHISVLPVVVVDKEDDLLSVTLQFLL